MNVNYNNDDSGDYATHQAEGRWGHSRQRKKHAQRPDRREHTGSLQGNCRSLFLLPKAFQIPSFSPVHLMVKSDLNWSNCLESKLLGVNIHKFYCRNNDVLDCGYCPRPHWQFYVIQYIYIVLTSNLDILYSQTHVAPWSSDKGVWMYLLECRIGDSRGWGQRWTVPMSGYISKAS